jgi:hypothetical protein
VTLNKKTVAVRCKMQVEEDIFGAVTGSERLCGNLEAGLPANVVSREFPRAQIQPIQFNKNDG